MLPKDDYARFKLEVHFATQIDARVPSEAEDGNEEARN